MEEIDERHIIRFTMKSPRTKDIMRIERLWNFAGQFRRYLTSIWILLKGLFLFKPGQMIRLLAFSFAGTTLQAFSLGSTFFILRYMDNNLLVKIHKLQPFINGKVHAGVLLAGVLAVLGLAILLIYLADRTNFQISKDYTNKYGAVLVEKFPLLIGRIQTVSVNSKTGIPVALSQELSNQSLKLCLACKLLLESPVAISRAIYGAGFLLVLQPLLTGILLIVLLPFLVPIRRFALRVIESERLREESAKSKAGDIQTMGQECDRLFFQSGDNGSGLHSIYNKSAFALSNHYRAIIWKSVAASRAIATGTMVVAGVVCMLFFGLTYNAENAQVATIVVYFGALRMAVMSGREVVARFSNFARFYDRIRGFLEDRTAETNTSRPLRTRGLFEMAGPDLSQGGSAEIKIEGGGPHALVGVFPLTSINRYTLSFVLPKVNRNKQRIRIGQIGLVTGSPEIDQELKWRDILGISKGEDAEKTNEALRKCCRSISPDAILRNLDGPVRDTIERKDTLTHITTEAQLLRAHFTGAQVVAITEEALENIEDGAIEHWKELFSDCLVFIYYKYKDQDIGRWGEKYFALLGHNSEESLGIAPVDWLNENRDKVKTLLTGHSKFSEDLELDDDDNDG